MESLQCLGVVELNWSTMWHQVPSAVRASPTQISSQYRCWRHCQGECVNNQKEQNIEKNESDSSIFILLIYLSKHFSYSLIFTCLELLMHKGGMFPPRDTATFPLNWKSRTSADHFRAPHATKTVWRNGYVLARRLIPIIKGKLSWYKTMAPRMNMLRTWKILWMCHSVSHALW